jgi:hypothetical protein
MVVASGCAGVPDSGSVHVGRSLPGPGGIENDDIRVLPAPPHDGMTPVELVDGFLRSLVYSEGSYGIARDYLAPDTGWHPSQSVTTYDEEALQVTRTGPTTVAVRAPRIGVVDGRGEYTPAPGLLEEKLGLTRSAGEWRINRLPPTVLLSALDANRSLQAATIYFLNRQQTRLVPDQLLVNVQPAGLATTLVRTLLTGPPPPLAAAVHTAVPADMTLLGNVPIDDDGTAEVNLPVTARDLPPASLARLSAQLVWTLRQLSGVTALRLLADGRPLSAPGVPSRQPLSSWASFDPDGAPSKAAALVVRNGRLTAIGSRAPASVAGRRVRAAVLSDDGARVAALRQTTTGNALLSGSSLQGPLRTRQLGGGAVPPSFLPEGDVVTAVTSPRSQLELVTPGNAVRVVAAPAAVRSAGVTALRVSRDGTQLAMVLGPVGNRSLAVGLLTPSHGSLAVTDVRTIVPGVRDVSGVAWAGGTRIVSTERASGGRRSVIEVDADGYEMDTLPTQGLPGRVDQVAAAPGRTVLAGDGRAVWSLTGATWTKASTGASPTYPD